MGSAKQNDARGHLWHVELLIHLNRRACVDSHSENIDVRWQLALDVEVPEAMRGAPVAAVVKQQVSLLQQHCQSLFEALNAGKQLPEGV